MTSQIAVCTAVIATVGAIFAPSVQGEGIGGKLLERVKALCPGGWALHVAASNESERSASMSVMG